MWFDSGSSHEAVLPFRDDHHWPADIYLEGSDQHRGWFHSSLLVGIGTRGRAPFNQVLTHGFTMDDHGRKMSKSLGNTVAPQDIIKQSGAEILRLWVSMVDYREDIRVGKEVLARTVEAYRRSAMCCACWSPISTTSIRRRQRADREDARDRSLGAGAVRGRRRADRQGVRRLRLPGIFQVANHLITVDLSAFYIDVAKDRMYTFGRQVRRAALRPDRDVHHRRRPGAPARADPVGDHG